MYCVSLICVVCFFLCDTVCFYAFMLWRVFDVCLSLSSGCCVRAVLLISCLFSVFAVCFVCGVLCCCLLFHWFVVRGYAVVAVLFSVLFCFVMV